MEPNHSGKRNDHVLCPCEQLLTLADFRGRFAPLKIDAGAQQWKLDFADDDAAHFVATYPGSV
jgi:hypothetical protein